MPPVAHAGSGPRALGPSGWRAGLNMRWGKAGGAGGRWQGAGRRRAGACACLVSRLEAHPERQVVLVAADALVVRLVLVAVRKVEAGAPACRAVAAAAAAARCVRACLPLLLRAGVRRTCDAVCGLRCRLCCRCPAGARGWCRRALPAAYAAPSKRCSPAPRCSCCAPHGGGCRSAGMPPGCWRRRCGCAALQAPCTVQLQLLGSSWRLWGRGPGCVVGGRRRRTILVEGCGQVIVLVHHVLVLLLAGRQIATEGCVVGLRLRQGGGGSCWAGIRRGRATAGRAPRLGRMRAGGVPTARRARSALAGRLMAGIRPGTLRCAGQPADAGGAAHPAPSARAPHSSPPRS